jgi:hypothetical protein
MTDDRSDRVQVYFYLPAADWEASVDEAERSELSFEQWMGGACHVRALRVEQVAQRFGMSMEGAWRW